MISSRRRSTRLKSCPTWLVRSCYFSQHGGLNACYDYLQIQGDLTGYTSLLRVDPLSRCAGLLLPQDAMAITPFFQDQIELEGAEEGMARYV